jgi:NADH dehydrogenase FAD-containing subunit
MSEMDSVSRNLFRLKQKPDSACCPDHLIGSPLAFASVKYATKAWKRFEEIPGLQTPAIHFVQGSVTSVNCQERHVIVNQHDKREPISIFYDYLIAASGLRRSWPTVPRALGRNEYLMELATHIHLTENASDGVIVIGGGENSLSDY